MTDREASSSSPQIHPDNFKSLIELFQIFTYSTHTVSPEVFKQLDDSFNHEVVRHGEDEPYGFELIQVLKQLGFRLNPYIELLLLEIGLDGQIKKIYGNGVMRASMWILKYAKMPVESESRFELFRNGFARAALHRNYDVYPSLKNLTDKKILQLIPDFGKHYTTGDLAHLKELSLRVTKPANKLLAQMIVDLFFPASTDNQIPYFYTAKRNGTCRDAERAFQMIAAREMPYFGTEERIATIYENSGRPILMEKTLGFGNAYSAINLEGVHVNGVRVPPGTLVATQPEPYIFSRSIFDQQASMEIRVKGMRGLTGIDPIRLSAFSLDGQERAEAFQGFEMRVLNMNLEDLKQFCLHQMK